MQNIPHEFDIDLCFSKAACEYIVETNQIYDMNISELVLIKNVSKKQLIYLMRDNENNINFYHSTPGQGTRVASINLNEIEKSKYFFIAFEWNPETIILHLGSNEKLVTVIGEDSIKQYQVSDDGDIICSEDENHKITNIAKAGKLIFSLTAIDTWNETIDSINYLLKAESPDGFMFESILVNTILTILVTGFESYCKKRFLELEDEGYLANTDKLIPSFQGRNEKEKGISYLQKDADSLQISLLRYVVLEKRLINFQNYDDCKKAFNKAYNLKFGELRIDISIVERIKKLIVYRHKIIHVSPSLRIWNINKHDSEDLEFPTKEKAIHSIQQFSLFIERLHKETLNIK